MENCHRAQYGFSFGTAGDAVHQELDTGGLGAQPVILGLEPLLMWRAVGVAPVLAGIG